MNIATLSKYHVNLSAIRKVRVTRVSNAEDRAAVLALRFQGYRGAFSNPEDSWSKLDGAKGTHLLLARDERGVPVGTIRVIDSRLGEMEIDDFSSTFKTAFHSSTSYVELARLVAIATESVSKVDVQGALWRASHMYIEEFEIDKVIAWAKRGPDKAYEFLQFRHIPGAGFSHPQLGNKWHRVFCMDIATSKSVFENMEHPLFRLFFESHFDNLLWYR